MRREWGRAQFNWLSKAARALVFEKVSSLPSGSLTFVDILGTKTFSKSNSLSATVIVHHPRFYRRAMTGGSMGIAASYLDGDWTCDDLSSFFRIFLRGLEQADKMDTGVRKIRRGILSFRHLLRRNTRNGSKKNIRDHYDLGNEFFKLFLDETMSYSCAVFDKPGMSLLDASIAKLEKVCRKLALKPHDHLLEIGTGWGGLAIHAAKNFGCKVTTTTISKEQYDMARSRIAAAGLSDRVDVLLQDYRDLSGQYDKLVSIEMIEAVGHEFLPTYFDRCAQLLKPEGLGLMQAITMPDHRYDRYLRNTDFIQQYIFPGSCVPSLAAIENAVAKGSDFTIVDREEIGSHYATTLQHWRQRFFASIEQVKQQGYSQRFIRMWDYYLCYCNAGFLENYTGVSQLLLAKPKWNRSEQAL